MIKKHCLTVILYTIVIAFCGVQANGMDNEKIKVGVKAPAFEANASDGQKIKSEDSKGKLILLSFTAVKHLAEIKKASAIRAQLAFLKSIKRQHEQDGIIILLVDASGSASKEEALNFMYDNDLQTMPLLTGKEAKRIAENYGVHILPTTFLIDRRRMINQIWQHVALSSQLAIAVNALLMEDKKNNTSAWDTQPQTIFPGFALARPLGDKIWLADDGKKWNTTNTPVRLFVLNNKEVEIKLIAVNNTNGEKVNLLDAILTKIPDEESKILLQNMPEKQQGICGGLFSLSIKRSGKYVLKASVFNQQNSELLFTGTANITVE